MRHSLSVLLLLVGCRQEDGVSILPGPPAAPPALEAPGSGPVVTEQGVRQAEPAREPEEPRGVCQPSGAEGRPFAAPRGWVGVEPAEGKHRELGVGLKRARARALSCYQASLRDDPGLRGAIGYTLRLGAKGEPVQVDIRPEDGLPAALLSCMEAMLWGLRLEASAGQRVEGRFELRPERPGPRGAGS